MADFTDRILDLRLERTRIESEAALLGYSIEGNIFVESTDNKKALNKIKDSIRKDFDSVAKFLTDKRKMVKFDKEQSKKLRSAIEKFNKHAESELKRKTMFVGFDPAAYTKDYTEAGKTVASIKKKVCTLRVMTVDDREKLDAARDAATAPPKRDKELNAIEYGRTIIEFAQKILAGDMESGPSDIDQMCKPYIDALTKMEDSADPDVMDVAECIRYVASAEVAVLKGYAKWRENLIKEIDRVSTSILKNAMIDKKVDLKVPINISLVHADMGLVNGLIKTSPKKK